MDSVLSVLSEKPVTIAETSYNGGPITVCYNNSVWGGGGGRGGSMDTLELLQK